jgi:hypothetical protein
VELSDIQWPHVAHVGRHGLTLNVGLYAPEDGGRDEVRFEIFSDAESHEPGRIERSSGLDAAPPRVVHSEGVVRRRNARRTTLDLASLLRGATALPVEWRWTHDGGRARSASSAVKYGRDVTGAAYVVAELGIADAADGYALHPSVLDGVLEACRTLLSKGRADVGIHVLAPHAVETVEIEGAGALDGYAVVRDVTGAGGEEWTLDVELCDAAGDVWARLSGLTLRKEADETQVEPLVLLSRTWRQAASADGQRRFDASVRAVAGRNGADVRTPVSGGAAGAAPNAL